MSGSGEGKSELRRNTLSWRRTRLGKQDRRNWSRQIADRLVGQNCWSEAEQILFYAPIDGEVQVQDLVRRALNEDRKICLPRVGTGKSLSVYRLKNPAVFLESLLEDSVGAGLERGSYGVLEPIPDQNHAVPVKCLDLVLVPGVVFDREGNRIGYGKGFYDRFLNTVPGTVTTIGLAYRRQILTRPLPVEPHDRPVDILVHEEGICRDGTD